MADLFLSMATFLRNILAVILLQPALFIEPHPRTMRFCVLASIALSAWAMTAFSPGRVFLFYMVGMLSMVTGTWPWSRGYGAGGPWRTLFAFSWCTLLAIACSELVGDLGVQDLVAAAYLFVAITLQARLADAGSSEFSQVERQQLLVARATLGNDGAEPIMALSNRGAIALIWIGPTLARWKGFDIPEHVVDALNRKWVFEDTTTAIVDPETLGDSQLLLPPGAIYRLGSTPARL